MSGKKLTLGEKIALAASGNQEDEFPEDIEYGDTSAKVTELDEDHDTVRPVARSSLRTKNVQLLDEFDARYSGEKVSRKRLAKVDGIESNEDDDDESGDENDQGAFGYSDEDVVSSEDEEEDVVVGDDNLDEDERESSDSDSEVDEDDIEDDAESEEDDSAPEESATQSGMQTLSLRDKQAEIQKGKATLNQLRIWDSLLEVRIRLQKMLLDCNRLPKTVMYEELVSDVTSNDKVSAKFSSVIEKSEQATKTLMHELIRLQKIMTEKNEETKKALSKKISPPNEENDDPMNEEITSESEEEDNSDNIQKKSVSSPERKRKMDSSTISEDAKKMKIEDFQSSAEASFSNFIPYRNQTIQKWNDKTQFAGGKFNRKTASQQISTLRQIEQILSNKERLVKRTQVKRSTYSVIGDEVSSPVVEAEVDQEPNPEIFDDDDFYHQLLRELIERKTSNVNDPLQLSHHWLELQKLRTKLKRKVDTKASKGRKIRYDVQAKLVNFMAPQDNCNMSSAAVKELFGSLFGQTKQ